MRRPSLSDLLLQQISVLKDPHTNNNTILLVLQQQFFIQDKGRSRPSFPLCISHAFIVLSRLILVNILVIRIIYTVVALGSLILSSALSSGVLIELFGYSIHILLQLILGDLDIVDIIS